MSSKTGRKKYKRQKGRQRRWGGSSVPGREGNFKKRGFQTPGNTLPAESVASLGNTEGNIQEGKIDKQLKPTDYKPNTNSPSGKAAQTPASTTRKWGQGRDAREARAAVLCKNRAGTPHAQPERSNLG